MMSDNEYYELDLIEEDVDDDKKFADIEFRPESKSLYWSDQEEATGNLGKLDKKLKIQWARAWDVLPEAELYLDEPSVHDVM